MKQIIFIIILYFFINNPVFQVLGFGSIKLLYPLVILVALLINKRIITLVISRYPKEILCIFSLMLYTLLRGMLNGDFIEGYKHLVNLIELFLLSFSITTIYFRYLSHVDFDKLLLHVGIVGSIISVYCFVNPSFNNFVRNDLTVFQEKMVDILFRGFGIAIGLTYSYAISQAIILSMGLLQIKKYKWISFFIPIFLISILFNARIGMIPLFISLVLFLFQKKGNVMYIAPFLVLILFTLNYLQAHSSSEESLSWATDFFYSISDFFMGTNNASANNLDVLVENHIVLPDTTIQWIFGRGENLFLKKGHNTDIGYLLQLNYGGIIQLFIIFMFIVTISKRLYRIKEFNFMILFIFTCLICHIKGVFLPDSEAFKLLFLIYIFKNEFYHRNRNTQIS